MTRPIPARGSGGTAAVVGLVVTVLSVVGIASVVVRGGPVVIPGQANAAPATAIAADSGVTYPAVPALGTALVVVGAGPAAHPYALIVADLLDRHFSAINQRDHASWAGTVTASRVADFPPQKWLTAYRSTTDSAVEIVSMVDGSSGVLVGLRFMSEQQPEDAPPDLPVSRICWASTWPVGDLAQGGLIGTPDRGATSRQAC